MVRSSRKKINKEIMAFNDTLDYRIIRYIKSTKNDRIHILFIFSSVDPHVRPHKLRLNKLRKTEIIPSIFFDHKCIQLEINNKKKNAKDTHTEK